MGSFLKGFVEGNGSGNHGERGGVSVGEAGPPNMLLGGTFFAMCGSRKYQYPHHGGNWKFRRGGGVKSPGKSRGEGG